MKATVLSEYLRQRPYIVLSDKLAFRSLLHACHELVKLIDMLLQGVGQLQILSIAYLYISFILGLAVHVKQFLERHRTRRQIDLSLYLEPLYACRHQHFHISRLNDALELQFPAKRPLKQVCALMLIGKLKKSKK